jgi:spermidine synthase
MAILWRRDEGGRCYEVRSAGRTRRLYTDGVFHSQYNPSQPVTGNLWDLFLLAGLCLPRGGVRRALMLGVGGGAAIRLLRRHLRPACVVGVDIDRIHLTVARRFFGVRGGGAELHCADAVEWLTRYAGRPFDLIVDDLFGGVGGEPFRAVEVNRRWAGLLTDNLTDAGVLAVNFTSTAELKTSACAASPAVRRRFGAALSLKTPQNENTVGVFTRRAVTGADLRARVRETPELERALAGGRLRYNARRLW